MHGELAPDTPKAPNEPMAIDPNSKVTQGATSGDGNDAKGKSKSKVDPAIFRMAEERDYYWLISTQTQNQKQKIILNTKITKE